MKKIVWLIIDLILIGCGLGMVLAAGTTNYDDTTLAFYGGIVFILGLLLREFRNKNNNIDPKSMIILMVISFGGLKIIKKNSTNESDINYLESSVNKVEERVDKIIDYLNR